MYFDRWDIVQAYYSFFVDFHAGQDTDEYKRLCRIRRYFTPSPMFMGYRSLTENEKAIYDSLVERERP